MSCSGLPNVALNCYMNSVLQTLFYVNELRQFILEIEIKNKDSFLFYFQCIFKNMNVKDEETLTVYVEVFKSYCEEFNELKEADANIFFLFTLNKLNSEIRNSISVIPEESNIDVDIISRLFRGEQEDRVSCDKCLKENFKSLQFFYSLPLYADHKQDSDIDQLLMNFFSMVYVDGLDCLECHDSSLYKHTVISKWPEYLIINMSRLSLNSDYVLEKNYNKVLVAHDDDDDEYYLKVIENASIYNEVNDCKIIKYILHAAINHSGNAYGGHYTCFVNTDFSWLEFNDLKIQSIDGADVINGNNMILVFKIKHDN